VSLTDRRGFTEFLLDPPGMNRHFVFRLAPVVPLVTNKPVDLDLYCPRKREARGGDEIAATFAIDVSGVRERTGFAIAVDVGSRCSAVYVCTSGPGSTLY